ncbi:hypothetical protein HGM15179_021209 [Zosterops borbonicus]|uniref:Parvovirus non-structural protein 1 helicase domain-containing protein n=1 Tax=Zosterops borbonicus TaxID=364589 RepID=A0A8K1D6E8_9PASS|nr:hypothetical protein HGM15179_021209 [Zosterops borbonicus]
MHGEPITDPLPYALFLNNMTMFEGWAITGEYNKDGIFHTHAMIKTGSRTDSVRRSIRVTWDNLLLTTTFRNVVGGVSTMDILKLQRCHKPSSMFAYMMKGPLWAMTSTENYLQYMFDIDGWEFNKRFQPSDQETPDVSPDMNTMTKEIIDLIVCNACKTFDDCLRCGGPIMSKYLHRPGLQAIVNNCLQFVKSTGSTWKLALYETYEPDPTCIHQILLHQGIKPCDFDIAFHAWIKKTDSKRNTICIQGPSNTERLNSAVNAVIAEQAAAARVLLASQALAECRQQNNPYLPGASLFGPTRSQMYGPDPCLEQEKELAEAQAAKAAAQISNAPTEQNTAVAPAIQLADTWDSSELFQPDTMNVDLPELESMWSPTSVEEILDMIAGNLGEEGGEDEELERLMAAVEIIGENTCLFYIIGMADTFKAENTWMAYIANMPYIYPVDERDTIGAVPINTGWHIFPNMLWRHFLTPKQWALLQMNYEAYHVESITFQVFNMIPMTTQLAIQGTTIFTAFNNCIYGLAYSDKFYETNWENWYNTLLNDDNHNLLYKEGQICEANASSKRRYILPTYQWQPANARSRCPRTYDNWHFGNSVTASAVYPGGAAAVASNNNYADRPSGVIWDPMNRPEDLMEIRPGKNAIKMHWDCHPCDAERWLNLDQLAWWYPYLPEGPYHATHLRPGEYKLTSECDPDRLASRYEADPSINDYTIPNWADMPVTPMAWWWKEMQESIAIPQVKEQWQQHRMNQFFVGTEHELYKYGPHQMFIKMIPLFDDNGTHIQCTANISVKTTLTLKVKKRRSAIYAPTWGPFSWFDLYTAQGKHRRFAPSLIRYKTGGARRTWQNLGDTLEENIAHPRETPYNYTEVNPHGSGQGGTRFRRAVPKATYSKRTDSVNLDTGRVQPTAPPMELMEEETNEIYNDTLPKYDKLYPPVDQLKIHQV